MNDFLGLLCRKSLLHVFRQNRTAFHISDTPKVFAKPPIPYIVNFCHHIKLREMINSVFTDLLMISPSLYPSLKTFKHAKTTFKWTFSLQISNSKKILIKCTLTNQSLTLQSTNNTNHNTNPILLAAQFKPTLDSIILNFIDEVVLMECKCLFGIEALCKFTWGLQIFTKKNQS